jgi:hypothetical protein
MDGFPPETEGYLVSATGDPVVDRADALVRLARAVDMANDQTAKALLQTYMAMILRSVVVPRPGEEGVLPPNVVKFPGPKVPQ